jgi:2,3,4,5-tetrahydropyridine-2-carboxylate N-succinyltransferase
MLDTAALAQTINTLWADRSLLQIPENAQAVEALIKGLDEGRFRVAELTNGGWVVNEWVKQAILLYFSLRKSEPIDLNALTFFDKIPVKKNYEALGVRAVPPAVARYGSFVSKGVILMPSYVNIGAWVGPNTMVDTWATVGSCAQIGSDVHLSGGVGIGGVLEPLQAQPVIIEDGAFIGSRAIVVEGVRVGAQAVLGANVVLTGSTRIIDVSGDEPVEYRGFVPPRSVVIPGNLPKSFPSGTYHVPCALIIGQRKASTDLKTSLNDTLRDFQVAV